VIDFFFCVYNMIMYVIIGKQKCIHCDELKNLLDEKGIQFNYLFRYDEDAE
jgi:glutaredoxin